MNQSSSYIKALEGFRGVCILLVLLHNLFPYQLETVGVPGKIIRELAGAGWIGVQWFFVLSGFLITRILLSAPKTLDSVKNFYVRRCLRIFPLYYCVLFVLLILIPVLGFTYPGTQSAIEHSGWFWFYASNLIGLVGLQDIGLSHFWSLAVEEQFYLVWPWLILFLGHKNMKVVCLTLIVSAVVARWLILRWVPEQANELNYVLTFVRWDALAIGALLALLTQHQLDVKKINQCLMVAIPLMMIWLLAVTFHFTDFKAVGSGVLVLNQTLAALIGGAIILWVLASGGRSHRLLNRILTSGFLCHLGKYSYAIYIFHLIVASGVYYYREGLTELLMKHLDKMSVELTLLTIIFIAIYFLARLSWVLIESPFLSLKKNFS